MRFSDPLVPGLLLRRYKRFFADVQLADGREVTAHCPNTGSMLNCLAPGSACWLALVDSPRAKLDYRLELVTSRYAGLVGVNTLRANQLVGEALDLERIPELAGYSQRRAEVPYGTENSRIDWLLSGAAENCYLEVKNVTLADESRTARFPDAVTLRGHKHLRELRAMRSRGHRAVLLFCVQIAQAHGMALAADIDPEYAVEMERAVQAGVEVLAYQAELRPPSEISLGRLLPFDLAG